MTRFCGKGHYGQTPFWGIITFTLVHTLVGNRGRHVLLRCETDAEIPILSIMEAIWPLKQVEQRSHIIHSSKTLMAVLSPLIATWHDTAA